MARVAVAALFELPATEPIGMVHAMTTRADRRPVSARAAAVGRPRGAALLGAALAVLAVAACGGVDRVAYLATTGERPADRTRYVDIGGPDRLGKAPPPLSGARHAPEPVPGADKKDDKAPAAPIGAAAEALTAAYAKTRQALTEIDDGYFVRRQSLRLYGGEYLSLARRIVLRPGDPLPADQKTIKETLDTMGKAIALMRGDLLRMHNILIQLDGVGLQAIALSKEVAAAQPTAAGDAKRIAELKTALDKSIVKARALAIEGRREIGAHIEYLTGQETSIGNLEDQLKNARPLAAR
jgi:hypothetical protein